MFLPIVYKPFISIPVSDHNLPWPLDMKICLDKMDVARSNLLTIRSQISGFQTTILMKTLTISSKHL